MSATDTSTALERLCPSKDLTKPFNMWGELLMLITIGEDPAGAVGVGWR